MTERTFDYRIRRDLQDLQDGLSRATQGQRAAACAFIVDRNLMTTPLSIRLSLKALKMRFGDEGGVRMLGTLFRDNPEVMATLWYNTMKHIVEGRDTSDPRSAGGWNGEEMSTFVVHMKDMGWNPGEVPDEEFNPTAPRF